MKKKRSLISKNDTRSSCNVERWRRDKLIFAELLDTSHLEICSEKRPLQLGFVAQLANGTQLRHGLGELGLGLGVIDVVFAIF